MSNTKRHDVSIYWFRDNGLRFHDNPCLKDACDMSKQVLPLYVIDPSEPFAIRPGQSRAGIIRANFILESIKEIDAKLHSKQSKLTVVIGKPDVVIPKIVQAVNANALFYEKDVSEPVRRRDSQVFSAIGMRYNNNKQCDIKGYDTHTLHPMEHYLVKCKGNVAPSTYGGFTKTFQSLSVAEEAPDISHVPPLPPKSMTSLEGIFDKDSIGIPTLEDLGYTDVEKSLKHRKKGGIDFNGGEDAALALLQEVVSRSEWAATFEKPKTSPNALHVDTTGLSPYVKHGCLSVRKFYHELTKIYAKHPSSICSKPPVSLHGQLMWREYNYLMGYTTPNFDKMVDNPVARQINWDDDPQLLKAWKNSSTGYPFIDAIMTQLRQTGYIHHLARHAVACFLTRGDLWQSWECGARIFEELLIDADWSINNFNWQWLSCTAHFYQYFRCYSPIAFGKKTDPNGDYIRKWLPQFRNMPSKFIYEPWEAPLSVQQKCGVIVGENYPYPIVDHKIVSKANMGRMKEAYDAHKQGLAQEESNNNQRDRQNGSSRRTNKRRKT